MSAKSHVWPFFRANRPLVVILLGIALFSCSTASADDWPTYRHDMARSGVSAEQLATPLQQSWMFESRCAPKPAWGDPKAEPVEDILELRRFHFDDVFQPVAADGAVYFGSSADNKVYCLDAKTGKIRWTKITGGPIRLAPTLAAGRVYVGSDDGFAYCLDARDGSTVWKFRAAPEDRRVLGHGRMISLWPLRTGVVVDGDVAYLSSGIFPAEGVFLYALDAATGRRIWCNDSCGEAPQSRISPQGYLLASKSNLYVPMGRVSPAKFDRADGRLVQDSPFFGKTVGGAYALLAGEDIFTGTEQIAGYRTGPRDRFATFAGRKMVVTEETAFLASDTELSAIVRSDSKTTRWKLACECSHALILGGDILYGGGVDQVVAVDASTGKLLWQEKIEGIAKGLAIADGRLLVSTDKGRIYSFGAKGTPQSGRIVQPVNENVYKDAPSAPLYREAAKAILRQTNIKQGYCLVLGVETGQLAFELAKRSDLTIYAVSDDAEKVATVRKKLDAAGVYGDRVCVEHWPKHLPPYADFFANLIVSETLLVNGELPAADGPNNAILSMLKPMGGVAILGHPDAMAARRANPLAGKHVEQWIKQTEIDGAEAIDDDDGVWLKITRGPLPGAGSWTHQYADPGNTACSDDQLVKAPFQVLWFGHPGPGDMMNRHRRAAGPLSLDGRMFVQGENVLMAYDAYNGMKLWRREIQGAIRPTASHDCSNLALSRNGLFVAIGQECLRLDPATGETLAKYKMPPAAENGQAGPWGYVACVGDLLLGSQTTSLGHSGSLFALDAKTGRVRWARTGEQIANNSIAVGDGKVFLTSKDATTEQRRATVAMRREQIKSLSGAELAAAQKALADADIRLLAALDVKTGKPIWEKPIDVTNCGGWHAAHKKNSSLMAAMYNDGVLVLFGVYLDGHYWEQFFAGDFDSRRVVAFSGNDGGELWSRSVGFRVRPVIVGDTLHTEPWAFDLKTGEQRMRINPITGATDQWQFARPGHHCGCPCAAPNCLFFRSYNLGYYDLLRDYGTMHFGAHRAGCWINFIPAAGLLLVPEASAGCMCSFPNMCTVVFQPADRQKGFGMYSTPGPLTPVKRLAINLGAGGDRNDAAGDLWLSFPRPYKGRLVLPLKVDVAFHPGGRFVRGSSSYTPFDDTDDPWLFASAAAGLRKCSIPLLADGDDSAVYRVALALADPENSKPGQRVFDIKLQGKVVAKDFDIIKAAGGRTRTLLKTFDGIAVDRNLEIELVPKGESLAPNQLPILQGVEITRQ